MAAPDDEPWTPTYGACVDREEATALPLRAGDLACARLSVNPVPVEDLEVVWVAGNGKVLVNLATAMEDAERARKLDESQLVPNETSAGGSPLQDWIGDGAVVFSY